MACGVKSNVRPRARSSAATTEAPISPSTSQGRATKKSANRRQTRSSCRFIVPSSVPSQVPRVSLLEIVDKAIETTASGPVRVRESLLDPQFGPVKISGCEHESSGQDERSPEGPGKDQSTNADGDQHGAHFGRQKPQALTRLFRRLVVAYRAGRGLVCCGGGLLRRRF